MSLSTAALIHSAGRSLCVTPAFSSRKPRPERSVKWGDHMLCYGDDHTSFQEAGIPAITPMDCVEAHNFASTEDTPNYHRTTDTFDTLHMGMTRKVASVIVVTLAELAEPVAK